MGQEDGAVCSNSRQEAGLAAPRLLGVAVGSIEDHGRGRGRLIETIERGLDRMVPHIKKPLADREPQPDATGRMAIGAGLDLDVEHLCPAATRNWMRRDTAWQPRRDRLGGEDGRRSDPLAQAPWTRTVSTAASAL